MPAGARKKWTGPLDIEIATDEEVASLMVGFPGGDLGQGVHIDQADGAVGYGGLCSPPGDRPWAEQGQDAGEQTRHILD